MVAAGNVDAYLRDMRLKSWRLIHEASGFAVGEQLRQVHGMLAKYSPAQPRVPGGDPAGGQWTSGGGASTLSVEDGTQYADSGTVMDDAGNIYPYEDSSLPKPNGIPDNWNTRPSRDNKGTRYTDPNNTGNEVRTMPGEPDSQYPTSREPYVRWMKNGQLLDKTGNININPEDTHIRLEEFEFKLELFL